jgi:hypothetical protein
MYQLHGGMKPREAWLSRADHFGCGDTVMRFIAMTSAHFRVLSKICSSWRETRCDRTRGPWGGGAAGAIWRLRALAPYALLELILPGGTVIALLLWLYRRRTAT